MDDLLAVIEPINLDDISLWDYEKYETANGLRD